MRGPVTRGDVSTVVALPGPLRPELREALLALYRQWVRTGRAERPTRSAQDFAGSDFPKGQNVRSDVDTSENTKTSVPPTIPM